MESYWTIQTQGWLPGWAGILLFIVVGIFLVYQLRRELAQTHRTPLTTLILPLIRLAVCALVVWLLCRPVITYTQKETTPAQFLLLTVGGRSLQTTEHFKGLGRKIDLLETLTGKPIKDRKRYASTLARLAGRVTDSLESQQRSLRETLMDFSTGLPLDPELSRELQGFSKEIDTLTDAIQAQPVKDSPTKDNPLHNDLLALQKQRRDLIGRLGALTNQCNLVARELHNHPEMLQGFQDRIQPVLDAAGKLEELGRECQSKQDQQTLTGDNRKWIESPFTRKQLAKLAGDYLVRQLGPNARINRQERDHLLQALQTARNEQALHPLGGLILLSDATSPIHAGERDLAQQLSASDLPVHALLVGEDGVAPHDAALLALDMPRLLLRGQSTVIHLLVKNNLPPNENCKVDVMLDSTLVTSHPLPAERRGQFVIEIPLTLKQAGHLQLQFQLRTPKPDAYPGNECLTKSVDVLAEKAQVLLVADRISDDFAAYKAVLETMPIVNLQTMLSAPELSKLRTGNDPGEFPEKLKDWQGIDMVVLLGGIPEPLLGKSKTVQDAAILQTFKKAIGQGLHVLIVDNTDENQLHSWASLVGLQPTVMRQRNVVRPADGKWYELYRLGIDESLSRQQWKRFGKLQTRTVTTPSGKPILLSGDGAVMSVIPQEKGLLVFDGLPPIKALTASGNVGSVSRLIRGILDMAIQPETTAQQDTAKPANLADFALTPHGESLRQLATDTGGVFADLSTPEKLVAAMKNVKNQTVEQTWNVPLWRGSWSLIVLLLLVSAEYLLRRKAGRIM